MIASKEISRSPLSAVKQRLVYIPKILYIFCSNAFFQEI
jgi:hypothetical protein